MAPSPLTRSLLPSSRGTNRMEEFEKYTSQPTDVAVLTGDDISRYQFIARKGALKLEVAGMKKRGRSAYSIVKEVYKLKGSKKSVLEQMERMLLEWN